MKNTDWNIIFKLKELNKYLFDHDLTQLSMSSRKLRLHSTKETFETFNFYSLISNKDYNSAVIKEESSGYGFKTYHFINPYKPLSKELYESKNKFSNDLKIFNNNTKNFILNYSMGYYYLLYEIPKIFPNITTLVLNDSALTMEVLQYLFDNLKYLENLNLTETAIFKDEEISNDYTINYPTTLKSLKLGENGVIMVKDKSNSIGIRSINQDSSGAHEFKGTYQHLPNLITFEYYMPRDFPEENEEVIQFITHNPQIKILKLSGFVYNCDLFDIIKNLSKITHLEFKCGLMNEDLENYEMPVLHNINHLHVEIFSEAIDDMMKGKFPNVIELVKEIDMSIDCEKDLMVESYSNIKYLKFVFEYYEGYIDNFTLPELKYLESLEINLNYEEVRFGYLNWNVSACENLKLITFTKNPAYTPFEKFETTQKLPKDWDLYYFPHKLAFFKHS